MNRRKGGDGVLRIPNFRDMRSMRRGESRVFALRGKSVVTTVQLRIGGSFTQRLSILVEPRTLELQRVLVVTCLRQAPKLIRKKRRTK